MNKEVNSTILFRPESAKLSNDDKDNNSLDSSKAVLIACKTNFEDALLDVCVSKDKPYYTLNKMKKDSTFREKVKKLLDALLDNTVEPPEKCIKWKAIEEIK